MLRHFLARARSASDALGAQPDGSADRAALELCEHFLELVLDLLSQLPTRRFVRTLLLDQAVHVQLKGLALRQHPDGKLFAELLEQVVYYLHFDIDDHAGNALTAEEVEKRRYTRIQRAQRLAFKHLPNLKGFALAHCALLSSRASLLKQLRAAPDEELVRFVAEYLRLADPAVCTTRAFAEDVIVDAFEQKLSSKSQINALALYPTEAELADDAKVAANQRRQDSGGLALPKLNLQFLTLADYLARNFTLFQLEAAYEIRQDLFNVLGRVGARQEGAGVRFQGWARMAVPVDRVVVTEVRPPKLGRSCPAAVTAEVDFHVGSFRPDIRQEWDALRQHDVLFLLTVAGPQAGGGPLGKVGLKHVRGCELVSMRDEEGKPMNDFSARGDRGKGPAGSRRTLRVALDPAQYELDMTRLKGAEGGDGAAEDVYGTFNLLVRRKSKENNFKSVLQCVRDLINEDVALPEWLHDILLGYGDPASGHFSRIADSAVADVDFKDTFLSAAHLKASFPGSALTVAEGAAGPPFRVRVERAAGPAAGAAADGEAPEGEERETVEAQGYSPPEPGPYPQNRPKLNSVAFTPVQVRAVMSGVMPGMTMVVGPPGTGKTDVAVQIMQLLFHNHPNQRTLLITHSNQALNDLFLKLMERDVPTRYLLRLGMGEAELGTDVDFSRVGRVDAMLQRRLDLLAEVERMARIFGVSTDVAYTCETAKHFWLLHVLSRWEKFLLNVQKDKSPGAVGALFPFADYFADVPRQPLFAGEAWEADLQVAKSCFRHLKIIFQELEECHAFELLRGQQDRINYLMLKQARIIAMTCTHAAMKRADFCRLGFKFDNLVMEESAQVLEVETFIPMVLQQGEGALKRLKRVVLIGDHNQLPPVVQNLALQKHSNLEQSLFTRFVRLGVPYIELNAQGRARPSIAALYRWRYAALGDLDHVRERPEYKAANAGFTHEFQFVDVPDFNGAGETEPTPHFLQNLGEAEYVVTVYQYMRLLGYPADRITILTTYNGQKALLRDVVNFRCAAHPLFGPPAKIETVDKYQGQQNDFILLSLVRTKTVGHLRDVRRLIVAMSRARLGLYIFGRMNLFAGCFELQPVFDILKGRPQELLLLPNEAYGACGRPVTETGQGFPFQMPTLNELVAQKGDAALKNENQCIPCPPRAPAADAEAGKEGGEGGGPPKEAEAKA